MGYPPPLYMTGKLFKDKWECFHGIAYSASTYKGESGVSLLSFTLRTALTADVASSPVSFPREWIVGMNLFQVDVEFIVVALSLVRVEREEGC